MIKMKLNLYSTCVSTYIPSVTPVVTRSSSSGIFRSDWVWLRIDPVSIIKYTTHEIIIMKGVSTEYNKYRLVA